MFNSYNSNHYSSNSVKINAVSGAILKNHPKSWFERFHLDSERAKKLLSEGGHVATKQVWNESTGSDWSSRGYYTQKDDPDKNIVILQMMICGDMEVIAECVYEKDFAMTTDYEQEKENT